MLGASEPPSQPKSKSRILAFLYLSLLAIPIQGILFCGLLYFIGNSIFGEGGPWDQPLIVALLGLFALSSFVTLVGSIGFLDFQIQQLEAAGCRTKHLRQIQKAVMNFVNRLP